MKYKKNSIFLTVGGKIDSIFHRQKIAHRMETLYRQPTNMISPSIFCESCTTESQCDPCYKTQWILYCDQFDLCSVCGVPNHPDLLADGVHEYFSCTPNPCEACRPRQMQFLQSRGHCTTCFQKMDFGVCFTCYCMCESEEEFCKPYECNCSCGECFQNRNVYEERMREGQEG